MDIVERLRSENTMFGYYESPEIQTEAADEIERLRKRVELLERHLHEAVQIVEGWVPVYIIDALKALGEKE